MKLVVFTHPPFMPSMSMPRFASLIVEGMSRRGHVVEVWTASPYFYNLPFRGLKKWLGYLDQYLVFPFQIRNRIKKESTLTVFVFADQALGPWIPFVAQRPHVIHVHDFMALRSALGEYVDNQVTFTGRLYQFLIRHGFRFGCNFVSVSNNTQIDLHRFLGQKPRRSAVVYNGLNYNFYQMPPRDYTVLLSDCGVSVPKSGFILHVGGNQWYKNRLGVLEIYESYIQQTDEPLPLWMIGTTPTAAMKEIAQRCFGKGEVHFLTDVSNDQVCAAYSASRLLLFPSLAEGFGWPIAEAMACGCPVLTTGEAPMTEVGGEAAFYVMRRPPHGSSTWSDNAAKEVIKILGSSEDELLQRRHLGFEQAAKFNAQHALDRYEEIYQQVIEEK